MKNKKIDIIITVMKILLLGMMLSLIFIIVDTIFISKGNIKSYNSFSEFISIPINIAYIVMLAFAFISGIILIYFAIVESRKSRPNYDKYTVVEKDYLKELKSKIEEQEEIIKREAKN